MESGESRRGELMDGISESIREICGLPDCRSVFRKMGSNLMRRIKLLCPLFEELKDVNEEEEEGKGSSDKGGGGGGEGLEGFEILKSALDDAKVLLESVNQGSKLYQVRIVDDAKLALFDFPVMSFGNY